MEPARDELETRSVLVHTLYGAVERSLAINSRLRTLDFLNVPHKFVTIDATEIAADRGAASARGRLGLRR